jgi:protein involved in temperature-dependent protein secretion
VYVREREWVGASRCSWEETVRLTGVGKKGSGSETETEAVGEVEVEVGKADDGEAEEEVEGDEEEASKVEVGSRLAGSPGAIIPKVSPAPSQSELVSNGVWIWINSFSYIRSATLHRIIVVPPLEYSARMTRLTSNQSCQSLIDPSLTLMIEAV